MKNNISENVIEYVKRAMPDLLEGKEKVFLEKPFTGFYITFNENSDGLLVESYAPEKFALSDERNIQLFCTEII